METVPRYSIQLRPEQLMHYDRDHLGPGEREFLFSRIETWFRDGEFTHLDAGGGSGLATDRLLERFPNCRSTVIDSSDALVRKNCPHARKRTICGFIEDLGLLTEGALAARASVRGRGLL